MKLITIIAALLCYGLPALAQPDTKALKIQESYAESDMYYTPKSEEARTLYDKGHDLFNSSEFSQAIGCYKKALEIEPGFIDAMDNLGNSYRYSGMNDSAAYWYKKSIALYPKGVIAHQNMGIIYQTEEKYPEALKEYQAIIELEPENAEGYFGKANVYIATGKGKEAVLHAQKALAIYQKNQDPYEADALFIIGAGYFLQKDNKNAKEYLLQAKSKGKEIPEVLQPALE